MPRDAVVGATTARHVVLGRLEVPRGERVASYEFTVDLEGGRRRF